MIPLHLLNIAWQSLLLSACAWLVVSLVLRDARRRAWAAAMGLFVAVLAPFLILAWPTPRAEPLIEVSPEPAPEWRPNWTVKVQPIPARPVAMRPVMAQPRAWRWSDLVLPAERVWMSGVLLLMLVLGVKTVRAWLWRRGLCPGPRHRVCSFEGKGSPCVVGLMHPLIVVPKDQTFTEEQWRWLLAHEGEHLRGGDTAMAWCFEWVRAWLWWNPFVHGLINAWSQAREEVCDAAAVKGYAEGEKYADFLLEVASAHQTSGALAMAASRPARRLKARLLAVLDGRRVCERVGLGFMVVATCSIAGAVVIVSCSGVQADEPPQPKTTHRFVLKVTPGEFAARVKEVQAQGYTLMDSSSDDVAILKDAQGRVTEVRKEKDANKFVTRVYRVAPDFLSKAGPGHTARAVLEARGITFPEGCSVVFNPTTSQVIVKNTVATLDRVEQIINDLQVALPMVYLQTKIIDGPELIGEPGRIYEVDAYQTLLKSVSETKGVNLMSAPSVTSKLGTRATVEVVREVLNATGTEMKIVGVRVEIDPSVGIEGDLKLQGKLVIGRDIAPKDENEPAFVSKAGVSSYENVKQWDKPFDLHLKHGQTTLVHLGETRKGRFVTMFLTAKAIGPNGRDVGRFDSNLTPPVRGVQVADIKPFFTRDGKAAQQATKEGEERREKQIFLTAKVVDLPVDETAPAFDSIFNVLNIGKAASPVKDTKESPILPEQVGGQYPNGVFALQGILTDPQFQVVIRAISQKKGVDLLSMPSAMVKSGQLAKLTSGTQTCSVKPTIGPDGYTLDLSLSYEDTNNDAAESSRKITTAVTILDGQTLVLGGTFARKGEDQTKHSRLIFVTGAMIDPSGVPVKKSPQ